MCRLSVFQITYLHNYTYIFKKHVILHSVAPFCGPEANSIMANQELGLEDNKFINQSEHIKP